MYILNDDRCNTYVFENGKIEARRTGEPALFMSREEAEKAVSQYLADNPGRQSPVWWEEV